jgi:hypothetical protein
LSASCLLTGQATSTSCALTYSSFLQNEIGRPRAMTLSHTPSSLARHLHGPLFGRRSSIGQQRRPRSSASSTRLTPTSTAASGRCRVGAESGSWGGYGKTASISLLRKATRRRAYRLWHRWRRASATGKKGPDRPSRRRAAGRKDGFAQPVGSRPPLGPPQPPSSSPLAQPHSASPSRFDAHTARARPRPQTAQARHWPPRLPPAQPPLIDLLVTRGRTSPALARISPRLVP